MFGITAVAGTPRVAEPTREYILRSLGSRRVCSVTTCLGETSKKGASLWDEVDLTAVIAFGEMAGSSTLGRPMTLLVGKPNIEPKVMTQACEWTLGRVRLILRGTGKRRPWNPIAAGMVESCLPGTDRGSKLGEGGVVAVTPPSK